MRYLVTFVIIKSLIIIAFSSCGTGKSGSSRADLDTIYIPQYAERFVLLENKDSIILRVSNPWQGAKNIQFDYAFPKNSITLPRVICTSTSHIAFIDAVNATESLIGVSGAGYISNPKVRAANLPDIGYDMSLNYEVITSLQPDHLFIYEVTGEGGSNIKKLRQLGIPVVYISDYLEETPLARSEWVVAFGAIMGRMEMAQEVFENIASRYITVRDSIANNIQEKPNIMLNMPYSDIWYMPGDRSFVVQLIRDAGGEYLGKGYDSDTSRPISTEQAYEMLSRADLWLNLGTANSIEEVKKGDSRLWQLTVMQRGQLYNNNARTNPAGGSDFWESGVLYADRVLEDMAKIIHPELFKNSDLYYYKKLK